ncbi:M20 family metallopeptidase [Paracoccaceae bacterium]|nr:M20 family metallopeptidase [Paracoccaceae bacterium]
MAILNSIAGFENDMAKWRRHLHQNPELGRDCYKTAKYIQERLKEFGITEIHTGYASTGIVAIIKGKASGRTIGLRADMDALPIKENTRMSYSSKNEGVMHACGHDGHTTMLLGAARYLSETKNFSGCVALIFQPDEEATGGAEAMVEEGILEEFNIEEVYALHNTPSHDVGVMYTRPGPIMAGADSFTVEIQGKGGHAAYPHEVKDPIVAAMSIALSFQTIVSRNNIPSDDLVISITQVHSGTTDNVVPEIAYLNGTVRTFDLSVQEMVIKRMEKIISGLAMSFEVNAKLNYQKGYPPTINHEEKTNFAIEVAKEVCGSDKVLTSVGKEMGAEDFSYMLQKRPGAYLFMGIGEGAGLHNPNYDFNDAAAPVGASFFARLIEKALPLV